MWATTFYINKAVGIGKFCKNTSGLPASSTTCLNTLSVTSSIGAKIVNGFGSSCQKISHGELYLTFQLKRNLGRGDIVWTKNMEFELSFPLTIHLPIGTNMLCFGGFKCKRNRH